MDQGKGRKIMIVGYYLPAIPMPTAELNPILAYSDDSNYWFTPKNVNINIKERVKDYLVSPLAHKPLGAPHPVILKRPVEWKGADHLFKLPMQSNKEEIGQYLVDYGADFLIVQQIPGATMPPTKIVKAD